MASSAHGNATIAHLPTGPGRFAVVRGAPVRGSKLGSKVVSTGTDKSGGNDRHPRPPRHPRWPTHPIGTVVPVTPIVGNIQPLTGPAGPSQPLARRGDVPPAGEQHYVPDEVVLEVANVLSERATFNLARRYRLTQLQSLDLRLSGTRFLRWRITDRRSVTGVVRALEREASVLSVQPNYLAVLQDESAAAVEGDPAQYALAKLRLPQAHSLARGEKIRIAVIDSGIDAAHPDLSGAVLDSYDALAGTPWAATPKVDRHGTAVAGAIVAHARLMGAAPGAQILAARAFASKPGSSAEGTTFAILSALDWAVAHDARIINMSFAGPRDAAMARSLAAAHAKGIVLVAAAGNAGPQSPPLFPASDANVIAVTATDDADNLFSAANRGSHIAVAAPGVDLLLPAPQAGYQLTSGTSFAAAEVSGAVALLLERKADLAPAAVRKILTQTARDLGPGGVDPLFGAGLVDAFRALTALEPATPEAGPQAAATTSRNPGQN